MFLFIGLPLRIFCFLSVFYVAKNIFLPKFACKTKPLIVAIKHAEASETT